MAVETTQPTASEINDAKTPEKSSSTTPSSRYGRARKPKVSSDFVAHGKNVKNFLSPSSCASTTNGQAPEPSKQQAVLRKRASTSSNRLANAENAGTPGIMVNGEISITTPESSLQASSNRGKRKVQSSLAGEVVSGTTPNCSLDESSLVEANSSASAPRSGTKVARRGRTRQSITPQLNGDIPQANLKTSTTEVSHEAIGNTTVSLLNESATVEANSSVSAPGSGTKVARRGRTKQSIKPQLNADIPQANSKTSTTEVSHEAIGNTTVSLPNESATVEANSSASTPGSGAKVARRGRAKQSTTPQLNGDIPHANLKTSTIEVSHEAIGNTAVSSLDESATVEANCSSSLPGSVTKVARRGRAKQSITPQLNGDMPDAKSKTTTTEVAHEVIGSTIVCSLNESAIVKANCSANLPGSGKKVAKRGRPKQSITPQIDGDIPDSNLNTTATEVSHEAIGSTSVSIRLEDIGANSVKTPSGSTKVHDAKIKATPSVMTPASASTPITPSSSIIPGGEFVGDAEKIWAVGDLAWGGIGKFPYWPCIIMNDPVSRTHVCVKTKGRSTSKWYFLQFCGDNGRHSWLPAKNLLEFINKQQFFDLQSKVLQDPRKKAAFAIKFTIKPHTKGGWEQAVSEAEHLMFLGRADDRVQHFQRLYPMEVQRTKKDLLKLLMEEEVPSSHQISHPTTSQASAEPSISALEPVSPSPPETSPMSTDSPPKKLTIIKNNGKYKLKTSKGRNPLKLSLKEKMLPQNKLAVLKMKKQLKKRRLQKEKKDRVKRAYWKLKAIEPAAESDELKDPSMAPKVQEEKVKRAYRKKDIPTNSKSVQQKEERGSNEESTEVEINEEVESVSKAKRQKSPVKKRKKKKQDFGPDFDLYYSQTFDRLSDEHPELKEEDIEKYLRKVWLAMDDNQKLKYQPRFVKDDSSEEEKESEEESEENEEEGDPCSSDPAVTESSDRLSSSSPPPIVEAVSKRGKNNSLFRGFKNEKVCVFCEKSGETFKCQGFCCGYFHKDCISKSRSDSAPVASKKEDKNSGKSNSEAEFCNESRTVSEPKNSIHEDKESSKSNNGVETKPDGALEKIQVDKKEENSKAGTKGKNGDKDSVNGDFLCHNCLLKKIPPCFECGLDVHPKTNEEDKIRCRTPWCGRLFHESCLHSWPQAILTGGSKRRDTLTGQIQDKVLTCPQHVCHTCVSDNPSVIKERALHEKQLVRCIKCPTAYHFGNYCVPAGSEILSNLQIICPRHYNPPKARNHHVSANWCFICSSGGDLICCDLCPATFHAPCVKLTPEEYADGFICEDCKTGRFPLFGEIVWVKLGHYRWWPAQILLPHEIPERVMQASHLRGEFAVKFFGSGDHNWVSRGRVFLYHEGDSAGKSLGSKKNMNDKYRKAVEEAAVAHKEWCAAKMQREEESRQEMKPPQYIKIKANKCVGSVKPVELNESGLSACECDPNKENPCSQDDECLNRMLMVECNPMICKAGERCNNQRFEKRLYPPVKPFRTEKRGWGLRTLVNLKKGDFVIEYVGEIINEQEYKNRVQRMMKNNDENFYFLTIDSNRMVDAGPKGNVARFMNHSCDPNCETQKWTVNGDTRVGLFALKDIPQNSELVFNYNLDTGTAEKKECLCGASTCRGFIGAKKVDKVSSSEGSNPKGSLKAKRRGKENKKLRRKRQSVLVGEDDFCFICDEGGELIVCNNKKCPKAYHLDCIGKKSYPKGQWLCPWHLCDICGKRKVFRCGFCVSSFCKEHKTGNIHLDPDRGLCCKKHWVDADKIATHNVSEGSLSQSIVDEDGAQVSISTPKGEKMSESILSNELGTPISSEVGIDKHKTPLKRARCNLDFDTNASSPAKRGRPDTTEKVLSDLNNLVQ
nr:PREDICTED: histone-lysine N-methyltransferase NSD2-like isoform X2 [Bemisia tabaci]